MHRKKIRRWHKLLSVSGILVAIFGSLTLPMANAVTGVPTPDGIYGLPYSNAATQTQYVDFPSDVNGLQNTDFYFTGTATGCTLSPVPAILAFSFSLTVSNCSDGTYALNLKANSVSYPNGTVGPATDFHGDPSEINRTKPTAQFQNIPASTDPGRINFEVAVNHPVTPNAPYDVVVTGAGCQIIGSQINNFGMTFQVEGCSPGAQAQLTVKPDTIKDVFGNFGPATAIVSSVVAMNAPVASPTPTATPTPTPTPTPTVSPTASPTATPSASPTPTATLTATPTPTPSDPPPSVAVVVPPSDPPAPPTATEPQPVAAPVMDAAPTPVETESEPELSVSLPPMAVVRSKIVQVRKSIGAPQPVETVVEVATPVVEIPPIVIAPAVEPEVRETFNWQPVGYLAIALGGVAAAVGGGLLAQRMARVRRLRFG